VFGDEFYGKGGEEGRSEDGVSSSWLWSDQGSKIWKRVELLLRLKASRERGDLFVVKIFLARSCCIEKKLPFPLELTPRPPQPSPSSDTPYWTTLGRLTFCSYQLYDHTTQSYL